MEMGQEWCWAIWGWGGDGIGPCEGGVLMDGVGKQGLVVDGVQTHGDYVWIVYGCM